jgi:hypothetical protein
MRKLIINLKTAKALGLTIPESLLLRAESFEELKFYERRKRWVL